jgi:hypothetical protein
MSKTKVVITFYSRCGLTEKLAMATAVGAVQARALVRLRRVPDTGPTEIPPDCTEPYSRMQREYIVPAESDILWSDAVLFLPSPHCSPASDEWAPCLNLLGAMGMNGRLDGKVAAAFASPDTPDDWPAKILQLGFTPLPPAPPEAAHAIDNEIQQSIIRGRQLAIAAQAFSSGAGTWNQARSLLPDSHL